MLTNEHVELWHHWLIIFACCVVSYSIIYTCVFRKQLSNANIPDTNDIKSGQTHTNMVKSSVTTIDENKSINAVEIESKPQQETEDDAYSPLNCMKYASCVCSLTNATICSLASTSIFYHQYWEDPIYGTPGIPFYASCAIEAYFLVDLFCDIIVYFVHKLPSFRYDQLIHHLFSFCVIPWMIIPEPTYAWFMITLSLAMEVSTLFLDFSYFGKWYHCKETLLIKFKLGFVITWFLFRYPATIAMIVWLVEYGERLFDEYPLHKFIGVIFVISFNFIMQSLWSILIIRKTYHALSGDTNARQGLDLKRRRNSIEITNVTSEA